VPQASIEHLRPLGASEFYPRHWQYLHEKHSLDDFRKLGYFSDGAREHLRVGDTIVYTLCGGSKLPSEWQRGIAIVEEVPNTNDLRSSSPASSSIQKPRSGDGGTNLRTTGVEQLSRW
jgi:hypothetical protein